MKENQLRRLAFKAMILPPLAAPFFSAFPKEGNFNSNKELVLDFHRTVLNEKNAEAAELYVSADYIQHNPRIPDGLEAFKNFVRTMRERFPNSFSEIKRAISEGDLVVLHSHTRMNHEDRGTALVDIFRVKDGKIIEHWDVMQPVPEKSENLNSMF